ncbi:hypothetical protein CYY_006943 [Polysphondylium violaceum]|uniref:Clathrin light chain n=1 Tax=Polysphondylium violaceum TaxID=133409 RepID=A0A8J4PQE8_9MYCE|nr:hypothetical protein CYY_006943 [Polysphondylium violaceum]
MSDPFGDSVEVIEEFVEGDVDLDNTENIVEYVDEHGNTIEQQTSSNNNNDADDFFSAQTVPQSSNSYESSPMTNNGEQKRETAPAMKEYLEKHEKELKEKKRVSEEKRAKKIEEAKKSLENFYSEREAKKKTALKNNREHNKTLEEEGQTLSTDHSWESVVNMIDLQAKPNPTNKDTSRMREILIRLKNSPSSSTTTTATH